MKKRKTKFIGSQTVKRVWYRVNAEGKILGRLATKVAVYLRGKQKPIFTPQADCGDYIVIVNAEKVKISGHKAKGKMYFTHSGYPGGDKLTSFEKMQAEKPEEIIRLAVKGMLPKNRLAEKMVKKLRIFKGEQGKYTKLQELEV